MRYSQGNLRKRRKSKGSDVWVWEGMLYVTDDEGRRRQRSFVTGVECDPPSERDVRGVPSGRGARQAAQKLAEWREGLIAAEAAENSLKMAPTASLKVTDYVERYWDSRDITPETRQHYGYLLRHMKRPVLDVAMGALDTARVRAWLAELREEGLGQSMLNKTYNQLMYACRWAVENGDLERNPCLKRDTPKRAKHELNPLDEENVAKLKVALDNMQATDPKLADLADLALNSGMRIGELCALTFGDVDDKFIHIRNVVVRGDGGCRLKPTPKNGDRRDVPLNDTIRTIIARRRDVFAAHIDGLDGVYLFADLATPTKFPSPAYLGKSWSACMKTAGVVGVAGVKPRFHDLRDTFATQALVNGIDVVTVASILGHRDTSTTLRHYARWMPNANASAMQKMDGIVGTASEEPSSDEIDPPAA